MTDRTTAAVVVYNPGQADPEHVALAGFLGGYRGLTRDAYALDLRQFVAFCDRRYLRLLEVRRSDVETFGRELEATDRVIPPLPTGRLSRPFGRSVPCSPPGPASARRTRPWRRWRRRLPLPQPGLATSTPDTRLQR